ncbi:hypothetical protein E3N88_35581 [Mikania micrantha]|uniref:Reverse transcriptase Ty1/copia-type domain-containing protein n=1 Tax=Mikania micrantha TaxID=192012 RepID=A0A5N6M1V0_9ASTR|nr:hypothetical protein E3N88_35581 [Mikania micrantha]
MWVRVNTEGPSVAQEGQTSGAEGRDQETFSEEEFRTPTGQTIPAVDDDSTQESNNQDSFPNINEGFSQGSLQDDLESDPRVDHTPSRGLRSLSEVYERAPEVEANYGLLLVVDDEPSTFKEAVEHSLWRRAMKEELDSIERNRTWELVALPSGHKAIGLKWIFKLKRNSEGKVTKHKARLVAKGYVQEKGVDFDEVFAPVARIETIRVILALAAKEGWFVHHLDVKSAFLNGELTEEVYVQQPDGFAVKGKEGLVYRLRKALYGLRQAPRAWNARLDKALKEVGFSKCPHEPAVYTIHKKNSCFIIGVYVDDLIITGSDEKEIKGLKEKLKKIFDMSDLGMLSYYLGIEVDQRRKSIRLKQSGYAKKLLEASGMWECNPAKFPMEPKLSLSKEDETDVVDPTEYRRLIGSLRYLIHTRPDLSFFVGVVSRYMEAPRMSHLKAVKQILRYVKGTVNYGLEFEKGGNGRLVGYSDSSYGADVDDRKGTTGLVFYYSGSMVTWASQKQQTGLIGDLTNKEAGSVMLFVDNKSAIALMKNAVFHGRSKHIDTKFHFIRECVEKGKIQVEHVSGEDQKADTLTKALPRVKFIEMRALLGIKDLGVKVKEESVG